MSSSSVKNIPQLLSITSPSLCEQMQLVLVFRVKLDVLIKENMFAAQSVGSSASFVQLFLGKLCKNRKHI